MILAPQPLPRAAQRARHVTRLLVSVIATGVAPKSSYRPRFRPAHYDGLPADFTAESIHPSAPRRARVSDVQRAQPARRRHFPGRFVDWLVEDGNTNHPHRRLRRVVRAVLAGIRALPEKRGSTPAAPAARLHPARRGRQRRGVTAERFQAAVQTAKIGPDKGHPHITVDLIRKYAADLRLLNLV